MLPAAPASPRKNARSQFSHEEALKSVRHALDQGWQAAAHVWVWAPPWLRSERAVQAMPRAAGLLTVLVLVCMLSHARPTPTEVSAVVGKAAVHFRIRRIT